VRQAADDDINYDDPQSIKDYYGLINIFLRGINIQTFFPTATKCSSDSEIFFYACGDTFQGNGSNGPRNWTAINATKVPVYENPTNE